MAYRQYRRSAPPKAGTTRRNKFAGECHYCGKHLEANEGVVVFLDGWQVQHEPTRWWGSPTSGSWVGGCPKDGE